MFQRVVTICSWLFCCVGSFSSVAVADLPENCKSPESAFRSDGDSGRMNGETWTDAVQTKDGSFVLISAKHSQVSLLTSAGIVSKQIQLPNPGFRPTQVAVQSNGRILIAGIHTKPVGNGNQFFEVQILGLTSEGEIDPTFGKSGIFSYPSVAGYVNLAVRCDGQIYLAFDHGYLVFRKLRYEFVVIRVDASGQLDQAFGFGGTSAVRIGRVWNSPETVTVREDGAILVGGQFLDGNEWKGALFQLTPKGPLDSSFAEGSGIMQIHSFSGNNSARSIALLPDQGFITAGYDSNTNWISLAKHLPNGMLDATFGANGFAYSETPAIEGETLVFNGSSVAQVGDGELLIGGRLSNSANNQFWYLVSKFKANGEIDKTFGTAGFVSVPVPSGNSGGEMIADSSGSFVIIAGGRQPQAAIIHRFSEIGKSVVIEVTP